MSSTSLKGIRDFKAKQKLLVELIPSSNFAAFLVKTHKDYNESLPLDDERRLNEQHLRQAAQKWSQTLARPVNPQGKYLRYWEWILNVRIGLERVTAHDFFKASFIEFFCILRDQLQGFFSNTASIRALKCIYDDGKSTLPEDQRATLKGFVDELDDRTTSPDFGHVETPLDAEFEGLQSGISAGQLWPWHCFLTPESARQWNALVENGNYAMYSACLATLDELLRSKQWRQAIARGAYNVGVALAGGGSPEKDALLAGALAESTQYKVQYCLIDVSHEMMTHSQRIMTRLLRLPDKVQLLPGKRIDILKLHRYSPRRPEWSGVVWAILGGTIGNLPEGQFFESISAPSRPGDLMIIGLDTHDGETWSKFQKRIRTQYKGEEVYDLLLEGRRGQNQSVQIKFRKDVGDIPDSWIAEFWARCDNQKVVVTSTRYLLEGFVKFAWDKGWEHLHTVEAESSTFRQLLLRRF
jgi:hypothetical protein